MTPGAAGPRRDRAPDALRPVELRTGAAPLAEGSCLVSFGSTRVLCAASVQEEVPRWRVGSGKGWVTAEYAMLPRATSSRNTRERSGARGRTREIERLVGRSLRASIDLEALGPRTVLVDCDVIEADGGTRTAAVTGGYVALQRACRWLVEEGRLERSPMQEAVAAVSAGIVDGTHLLDLDYAEDVAASVDLNVVATLDGRLIEVQGTAEGAPFPRASLDQLVDLALAGIRTLGRAQGAALDGTGDLEQGGGG